MEAVLHVLGVCGDNQSHFDLIDIIIILGGGSAGLLTIKNYYKTVIYIFKSYFKQLIN
jgi:hypothetical protein